MKRCCALVRGIALCLVGRYHGGRCIVGMMRRGMASERLRSKSRFLAKRYVVILRGAAETTDEIADFGEKIRSKIGQGGGDYG